MINSSLFNINYGWVNCT
ncbi:unnamed protein product, partial [Rotaria socialis]